MVSIKIDYRGELHCSAVHGPSGAVIETDAPVDNNGKGEAFSPTDLVAAALGSCMMTVMGIAARQRGISLEGTTVTAVKEMSTTTPRKISKIEVSFVVPLANDHPERKFLEATAAACPVSHSIHPQIEVVVNWIWNG